MSEGGGGPPHEPWANDPFAEDDPDARERARRRAEREQRRAKRQSKASSGQPAQPSGPSATERASAALSGLGERISRRRAERQPATRAPQDPPGPDSPLEGEPQPFDFAEPEPEPDFEPQPDSEPEPGGPLEPEPGAPATATAPAPQTAQADSPPPRVSEPERYSHATPPPSGRAPRRGWLRRPGPFLIVAAIFVIALLLFANALFQPFHGDGEGKAVFTVKKGEAAGAVADRLDEEGIISSGTLFEIRLTLAGHRGDVFAGRYVLQNDMSYSAAIDELTKPPSQRALAVVVPEGYSREQIAKVATDTGLGGSYEQASDSSKLLDPAKYGAENAPSLEGFLFPSTYELKPKSTSEDLVAAQLNAFEQEFKKVDLSYAESKNLTPYDVLTIASMIDREVQLDKERPLVASVIYNRLDRGEPLGVDATIRYEDGNFTEPIEASRLEQNTPYNTYTNQGLPPTPIGNPGLAAIKAAAKPADTKYLFYVVKPGTCGEHVFTETLEEHEAAQAKYDAAREAAGGKSPDSC